VLRGEAKLPQPEPVSELSFAPQPAVEARFGRAFVVVRHPLVAVAISGIVAAMVILVAFFVSAALAKAAVAGGVAAGVTALVQSRRSNRLARQTQSQLDAPMTGHH